MGEKIICFLRAQRSPSFLYKRCLGHPGLFLQADVQLNWNQITLCKEVTKNNKESDQVDRIFNYAHFEVNFLQKVTGFILRKGGAQKSEGPAIPPYWEKPVEVF